MKDLVGNNIKVGDLCYHLKAGTSVRVCVVEILEFDKKGVICKIIKRNPTESFCRGGFQDEGYITKPLAETNLIRCNITL